jgi:hypothetical protein
MRTRASSVRIAGWLIGGIVIMIGPSCGKASRPEPERYLTDPAAARRAVEQSLEAWRNSPDLARTTLTIQPVMFVDQSRKPGQRLKDFTVMGEAAGADGCRQFQVKLSLEQPDESLLAAYYVFGQGPIWVYRAEDFEMMMRMDPMTKVADSPEPAVGSKTESDHLNHASPRKASPVKTGSRPLP